MPPSIARVATSGHRAFWLPSSGMGRGFPRSTDGPGPRKNRGRRRNGTIRAAEPQMRSRCGLAGHRLGCPGRRDPDPGGLRLGPSRSGASVLGRRVLSAASGGHAALGIVRHPSGEPRTGPPSAPRHHRGCRGTVRGSHDDCDRKSDRQGRQARVVLTIPDGSGLRAAPPGRPLDAHIVNCPLHPGGACRAVCGRGPQEGEHSPHSHA